ncbi:MAG: hypothetical protein M3Y59_24995 [Myxococcota bacterium]|nr:hypothetical protein [Myxococcota bacterium]
MRTALTVLLLVLPSAVLAQIPPPGAPLKHKSSILWDLRATAGATAQSLRDISGHDWNYGATLGLAGGVIYRGRPSAGLTARAALDLSFPDVPSLVTFGFGFALFPVATSPNFIRVTAGPSVLLGSVVEVGVGFEADTQLRLGDKLSLALGLGGVFRRRDAPFAELWLARATVGLAYEL